MKEEKEMTKGEEPFAVFGQLVNHVQLLRAEFEQQASRIAELEQLNGELGAVIDQLRNDPWSSRVTYDNVVDQIASNEDAAQRDFARKLIEPLLKRSQVTQFRKDIKRRVKELNDEAVSIVIEQAEVKVQSPGNNIAQTIINRRE